MIFDFNKRSHRKALEEKLDEILPGWKTVRVNRLKAGRAARALDGKDILDPETGKVYTDEQRPKTGECICIQMALANGGA